MAAYDSRERLDAWALDLGDEVVVFLLVTVCDDGQRHAPERVAGVVKAASSAVLVLTTPSGLARVPWPAIAYVEGAATPPASHPGLD